MGATRRTVSSRRQNSVQTMSCSNRHGMRSKSLWLQPMEVTLVISDRFEPATFAPTSIRTQKAWKAQNADLNTGKIDQCCVCGRMRRFAGRRNLALAFFSSSASRHSMGRLLPQNEKWNTFLAITFGDKDESLFLLEKLKFAHFFCIHVHRRIRGQQGSRFQVGCR